MNASQFLVAAIRSYGTDTVFSLTGGMAMHVNRAVAESGLKAVYCNHEQACVAAADGYAKIHEYQRPGFAVVTSGPGVTNTLTSLASAHHDSVPLIVIAGQIKRPDINRFNVRSFGAQEVPSLELVRPIVKAALRYDPRSVSDETLWEFLETSMRGRKGPVFIEVPLDSQPVVIEDAEQRLARFAVAIDRNASQVQELGQGDRNIIVSTLQSAARPALFLGNGLRIAGVDRSLIRSLVDKLGMPVLTTWPSTDLLDAAHDLRFGCPGGLAPTHSNRILQAADAILFLGTRLDLLTTGFNAANYGKRAKRLLVDIDKAELGKLAELANAVPIHADVRPVVNLLLDDGFSVKVDASWVDECRLLRQRDSEAETREFAGRNSLNARSVAGTFANSLTDSTVVATGSGYAIEGFARFFEPRNGNRLFYAGHSLGSMGLGLPSAVGAAAAAQRNVVCVEGDGGLMLNVQELLTLQANPAIRLSIAVLNNLGYLSISRSQLRAFGTEFGASDASGLGLVDLKALATCFSIDYQLISSPSELEEALKQISNGRSRVLLDIRMTDDEYRGPAIMTKFRDDGTPYSTDIEDVEWRQPS